MFNETKCQAKFRTGIISKKLTKGQGTRNVCFVDGYHMTGYVQNRPLLMYRKADRDGGTSSNLGALLNVN